MKAPGIIFGAVAGLLLAQCMLLDSAELPGAKGAALGGAYSAWADDEFAVFWNPAAMLNRLKPQLGYCFGVREDYRGRDFNLGAVVPLKECSFGMGVKRWGKDGRLPSGRWTGGIAVPVRWGIDGGFSISALRYDYVMAVETGYSMEASLYYRRNFRRLIRQLSAGLVVHDLYSKLRERTELVERQLPRDIHLATMVRTNDLTCLGLDLSYLADETLSGKDRIGMSLGGERNLFAGRAALRLGYQFLGRRYGRYTLGLSARVGGAEVSYAYRTERVHLAGQHLVGMSYSFGEVRLDIKVSPEIFRDEVVLEPVCYNVPAERWEVLVIDAGGTVVRTLSGARNPPEELIWDGKPDGKDVELEDGKYSFRARVFRADDRRWMESPLRSAVRDNTGPDIYVHISRAMLVKDEGGKLEKKAVWDVFAGDPHGIKQWALYVLDRKGKLFHYWSGTDGAPPEEIAWDGVNFKKKMLPDSGRFYFAFKATDELGNESETQRIPFQVRKLKRKLLPVSAYLEKRGLILALTCTSPVFSPGSAKLKDNAYLTLNRVADILREYPEIMVTIEGHTDNSPLEAGSKFKSKQALSTARAEAVTQYLIYNEGVRAGRLKAIGYGDARPTTTNDTPEGRQKNRRIEIVVSVSEEYLLSPE